MKFNIEAMTSADTAKVHECTLDLLHRYGIAMRHEEARKILQAHGAKVDGDCVRIPPDLVMKALATVPASFVLEGRNREAAVHIGGGHPAVFGPAAGTVFVSGHDGERRAASFRDLKNFLALSQTSSVVGVSCAGLVYPSDVPAGESLALAMMAAIETCDKPLIGLTQNAAVSEMSIAMARSATEGRCGHFVMGIVNSLSPMAWDANMLGSIISYASHNQPMVIACCSMAGFTSPTTLSATVIQNNAEILAGIVLAQMVKPGAPVVYGNTSAVTDMATMNLRIGVPEFQLISAAGAQLARHYAVPYRGGGGLTDAKEVDAQAGIESATGLLFTLANGVDFVLHAVGVMESFLCVGYDKWIFDEEIIGRVLRMKNDRFRLMPDAVDMIGNAAGSGSFITHPDTLENFRTEFYRAPVSDGDGWDTWKSNSSNGRGKAYGLCLKRLEGFEPPPLSPEVFRELDRLRKAGFSR